MREKLEGRRAAARLDAQKIALSGKRRVIDVVYGRAEDRLSKLEEGASLALVSSLLERYAEKGDEVVLAEGYPFLAGVKKLPVVREKALTVSEEGAKISGGIILRNQSCDRVGGGQRGAPGRACGDALPRQKVI